MTAGRWVLEVRFESAEEPRSISWTLDEDLEQLSGVSFERLLMVGAQDAYRRITAQIASERAGAAIAS